MRTREWVASLAPNGEGERPRGGARLERGRTISSRARGDTTELHGPLQRWLGVTLLSAPLAERSERLHTFQVQTSLSPTPAHGTAADLDLRA